MVHSVYYILLTCARKHLNILSVTGRVFKQPCLTYRHCRNVF